MCLPTGTTTWQILVHSRPCIKHQNFSSLTIFFPPWVCCTRIYENLYEWVKDILKSSPEAFEVKARNVKQSIFWQIGQDASRVLRCSNIQARENEHQHFNPKSITICQLLPLIIMCISVGSDRQSLQSLGQVGFQISKQWHQNKRHA